MLTVTACLYYNLAHGGYWISFLSLRFFSNLDASYIDGTAACNSTCSGYSEENCETDDGW